MVNVDGEKYKGRILALDIIVRSEKGSGNNSWQPRR